MAKEKKPREEKYRDALTGATRLGIRDVSFYLDRETESERITLDSGPAVPHGDDFRSVHDQLSDGYELFDLAAFPQKRHFQTRYE